MAALDAGQAPGHRADDPGPAGAPPHFLWKAGKIKPSVLAAVEEALAAEARRHPAAFPAIIATSSETGLGIEALRRAIVEAALGQDWVG